MIDEEKRRVNPVYDIAVALGEHDDLLGALTLIDYLRRAIRTGGSELADPGYRESILKTTVADLLQWEEENKEPDGPVITEEEGHHEY